MKPYRGDIEVAVQGGIDRYNRIGGVHSLVDFIAEEVEDVMEAELVAQFASSSAEKEKEHGRRVAEAYGGDPNDPQWHTAAGIAAIIEGLSGDARAAAIREYAATAQLASSSRAAPTVSEQMVEAGAEAWWRAAGHTIPLSNPNIGVKIKDSLRTKVRAILTAALAVPSPDAATSQDTPEESRNVGRTGFHELKTWPAEFDAVLSGKKVHEYRRDDRAFGYKVGDKVTLMEFVPCSICGGSGRMWANGDKDDCDCTVTANPKGSYTGRPAIIRWVSHVTKCEDWGGTPGHVVLSLSPNRVYATPAPPGPGRTGGANEEEK